MIVLGVGIVLIVMAAVFGDLVRVGAPPSARAGAARWSGYWFPRATSRPTTAEAARRRLRAARDERRLGPSHPERLPARDRLLLHPRGRTSRRPDNQTRQELILDHLVHSYNSLDDPNYLQYGYIKVYAEMADYLAQQLPESVAAGAVHRWRRLHAGAPHRGDLSQRAAGDHGDRPRRDADRLRAAGRRPVAHQHHHVQRRRPADGQSARPARAGQYDLIIGDAFNDLSIPYHLTTREFDQELKRLLKPGGFYLALVIDKMVGGKFIPAYTDTVLQVWPAVQVLADGETWASPSPEHVRGGGRRRGGCAAAA